MPKKKSKYPVVEEYEKEMAAKKAKNPEKYKKQLKKPKPIIDTKH